MTRDLEHVEAALGELSMSLERLGVLIVPEWDVDRPPVLIYYTAGRTFAKMVVSEDGLEVQPFTSWPKERGAGMRARIVAHANLWFLLRYTIPKQEEAHAGPRTAAAG
jgi:hypothetical protein